MNDSTATLPLPAIPPDVRAFAAQRKLSPYINAVIDLARQAFPVSALDVSVGRDAEDETREYIAIEVDVGGRGTEELLAGQRAWSAGLARVCPPHQAVYFVLGWR
jgi:hypothetical protein